VVQEAFEIVQMAGLRGWSGHDSRRMENATENNTNGNKPNGIDNTQNKLVRLLVVGLRSHMVMGGRRSGEERRRRCVHVLSFIYSKS
jgi:hypothetical protein